ncbi:hypothetical protein D3C71_1797490 [compost metagenome]
MTVNGSGTCGRDGFDLTRHFVIKPDILAVALADGPEFPSGELDHVTIRPNRIDAFVHPMEILHKTLKLAWRYRAVFWSKWHLDFE